MKQLVKRSTQTEDFYTWGDDQAAKGWHLAKSSQLSVIEELIPSGIAEVKHYHSKSEQCFYVLAGVATFVLAEQTIIVTANESIHIPANSAHQVKNEHTQPLKILVVSTPPSHGDRILLKA